MSTGEAGTGESSAEEAVEFRLPSGREFILKTHLYDQIEFSEEMIWGALDIVYFSGVYDSYCVGCKKSSTFKVEKRARESSHDPKLAFVDGKFVATAQTPRVVGIFGFQAICSRSEYHHQNFYIRLSRLAHFNEDTHTVQCFIEKIGQHPSFSDLHLSDAKQYKNVLSPALMSEFSRAINLASHDIGIGSYVYLRRIFESLVEEAHQEAKSDAGWDEETYLRMRMDEKISAVKHHLPEFLTENKKMYGVLSKGIHELSEKDCLRYFETMKVGIELILDEKLETHKRKARLEEARKAISSAVGDVS